MEQRRPGWRLAGTVSIVALLAVSALQLHSVEARLATQSQQLRALGEATERMAAKLERVQGGVVGASANAAARAPSLANVRHPELPDFLTAKETHWPPPGAKTNGVVAVDWSTGDPKGFNVIIENAAELNDKLRTYVESRLAQRNKWTDPDKYYGDLAWRVEVTDDYKTFTIYLRKGVKWHPVSGVDLNDPRYAWLNVDHELTAHDFVFHFDMIKHPQVQNGFAKSYYEQLESWKALDDYTLEVRWKKTEEGNVEQTLQTPTPLPRFLFAYAEDGTPIPEATLGLALNQHWYNNRGLVGTGPYRMVGYTPGNQIRLERNEEYYGELPAIKSIRYPIYTDRTQTVLKLKSGELSFGQLRSGQYREEVLQYQSLPEAQRPPNNPFTNGTIKCDVVDQTSYTYIGWNTNNSLFVDRRVRNAMTLALNRQEIISKVFSGLATIARGPFLESSNFLAPEIKPLPFDLKQAASLLKEAGWADTDGDGLLDIAAGGKRKAFEFTLLTSGTSPEWASAANIYKEDLLSIGVKMNVDAAEWSLMQKRMEEKKFDAVTGGWALPWSTDPYQIWHSSQADVPKGSNTVGFRNKEADALIESLRVTLDPAQRARKLQDFHRILHREQPYTFVYIPKSAYCYRRGLENVVYAKERPLADLQPMWSSQTDG
jgi:peptide/nickel transport system substrate-binding protein